MSPKYVLTYFNSKGRGEIIRWMFAIGGVEYEDRRIDRPTWATLKPSAPAGQIPLLAVDGTTLFQSRAITRYLAKEFGLVGKTPLDDAKVNAVADTIFDSVDLIVRFFLVTRDESETRGNELKAKYVDVQLPNALKYLENLAQDSGYFAGNELTWADVSLAQFPEWLAFQNIKSTVDDYPKLSKIKANVLSNPKLKEWLKKRPE